MGENNDDNNKNLNDLETAVTLEPPVARESLVQTAVQFLQNPKTRASSLKLKILFLKKKGLTEDEIQLAIDRSGTALYEEAKNSIRDSVQPPALPPHFSSNYYHQMSPVSQPRSPLLLLRDIANSLLAIGGIGYFVYWLYKKFIHSWLFGSSGGKRKRKPVPDQLMDMDVTLAEVKQELRQGLARLGADVEALANQRTADRSRDLQDLSAQVATVKGLLLNRSQFPSVPPTSAASPVKIPSWQLESVASVQVENEVGEASRNKIAADKEVVVEKQPRDEEEEDDDEEEDEEEESKSIPDADGSDSSLEMINSITNHHD